VFSAIVESLYWVKRLQFNRAAAHGQPDHPMMNLAAFWQQMLPTMPVLPVFPTDNFCFVNNLAFDPQHGMEEVVGSIPTRSTKFCQFP